LVNLDNILGGVTKNADKLGGLLGFLTGSPRGFADITSIVDNIIQGNIHAPDIGEVFHFLASEPFVKTGIMTWIAGYIISELKLPIVGKFGTPLQKFGMAYAAGAVANKLLYHSTHSDEGSADHLKTMFQRNVVAPNQGYNY